MRWEKDPNETLDFIWDWTAWLGSDTIATSSFQVSSDLTKNSESNTTLTATVLVSGGTPGQTYKIRNRIVTTNGRTCDRTRELVIREL